MIHPDRIRWRLKQLLVYPKRAIVGRFKLSQKVDDLMRWSKRSWLLFPLNLVSAVRFRP